MKSKKHTILIVDDMPTNIQSLFAILKDKYDVQVAQNGKRALEIANMIEKPDIILLDIVMPEMDGYDVCRILKSNPDTAEIPIIFVTAKSEAEDEEEGFSLGAIDFVAKPFRPSAILARVDTHLKLKEFNRRLSEQVESELAIRMATQKRYWQLFESSPIPIFIYPTIDGKLGKLEEVNTAAERLTGYTKEELLGGDLLSLQTPKSISIIRDCLRRIANGEAVQFESECLKKDDSITPVMIFAAPFIIDAQQRVYSYWMDLSYIKRIENEKLMKDRLLIQQSKLATMGEMIGAIGHQWKQPLNSLGITIQDVEYAFKYGELDELYIAEFKTKGMNIVNYMSKTIDDFKNFFSPNKREEQFFVEDAVAQTLKMLDAQLKNNSVLVVFDEYSTCKHPYVCNKNELSQVILNILANSKDALAQKKPENPFIKIDISSDDTVVVLSVEDSAGGIPQDDIDKVFNSYFTTKESSGGTGIGLYMSKTIIEEHLAGKLTVENTQNGAKFTIRLPRTSSLG